MTYLQELATPMSCAGKVRLNGAAPTRAGTGARPPREPEDARTAGCAAAFRVAARLRWHAALLDRPFGKKAYRPGCKEDGSCGSAQRGGAAAADTTGGGAAAALAEQRCWYEPAGGRPPSSAQPAWSD